MRIARYKSAARQDIDDISEYIAADNLDAAIRLCVAVEEAVEKLTDLPGMGRLREFSNPELAWMRSWVIKGFRSYLIFYIPVPDGIEVVRILHGGRELDLIFQKPD